MKTLLLMLSASLPSLVPGSVAATLFAAASQAQVIQTYKARAEVHTPTAPNAVHIDADVRVYKDGHVELSIDVANHACTDNARPEVVVKLMSKGQHITSLAAGGLIEGKGWPWNSPVKRAWSDSFQFESPVWLDGIEFEIKNRDHADGSPPVQIIKFALPILMKRC